MAYKALYRTYRPTSFAEVAGQKHIVRTLQNALANNKVAHAYLFTGPRGTGKTTMAKLMAKALNCDEGVGQQCNRCPNCLAVNDSTHPDVIEIDAASNNGVDEVRELIDKVKYAPIRGRYKIYIIDEVHMMTPGAFNALLKTLEEPPAHVVFILATTEPHKVIPTIVSRCQRYDFSKVPDGDIRDRMLEILKIEGIAADARAIDMIITLADGGVRDALSLLDQVLAYSVATLSEGDILELFGLVGTSDKINLLRQVARGDAEGLLGTLAAFTRHGVDIKRLVADLLDILKDLLIYLKTSKPNLLTTINSLEADDLLADCDYERIPSYLDMLLKAQSDFRFVANMRSLLEVTLLKMAHFSAESVTPAPKSEQKPRVSPDFKPGRQNPLTAPVTAPTNAVTTPTVPADQPQSETREPVKAPPASAPTPNKDDIVFAPVNGNADHARNHVPKVARPTEKDEELKPTVFDEVAKPEVKQTIAMPNLTDVHLATSGDRIVIDDDNIIKIMVSGLKEAKIALLNRWSELHQYSADPSVGKFATLLSDGRPYVLCRQVLVLEYDLQGLVDKVNIGLNQPVLQEIVKALLGKPILVYALSRNECIRLKKKYLELSQIKQLPERRDVAIVVKGYEI